MTIKFLFSIKPTYKRLDCAHALLNELKVEKHADQICRKTFVIFHKNEQLQIQRFNLTLILSSVLVR